MNEDRHPARNGAPHPHCAPAAPDSPDSLLQAWRGRDGGVRAPGPLLHRRSEWRARPSSAELGGAGRWGRFGAIGRDELPAGPRPEHQTRVCQEPPLARGDQGQGCCGGRGTGGRCSPPPPAATPPPPQSRCPRVSRAAGLRGRAWVCPRARAGWGCASGVEGGRSDRERGQFLSSMRSPEATAPFPCLWEGKVKDSGS